MILAAVGPAMPPADDGARIAASMGLFAGGAAARWSEADALWCQLAAPRVRRDGIPPGDWRAAATGASRPGGSDGWTVLLDGVIDNSRALAAELGLSPQTGAAALYGAALARWGEGADRRLVAQYAVIARHREARVLRLARSPWNAPPLFCAALEGGIAAASVPRPLFAAGLARRLRPGVLAQALFLTEPPPGDSWYEGLRPVPHGSVVHFAFGQQAEDAHTRTWYDPLASPRVRLGSDGEYVEAARALLDQAARAACAPAHRPGVLLSGGLDSALATDALLAALPAGRRLQSFTATPSGNATLGLGPAEFGDERPLVEAFAAGRPALEPHFVGADPARFDARAERFFLATDTGRPALALAALFDEPAQAASTAGCNWLFNASFGNHTLSNDGRWAYAEYARHGRWAELWRLARDHPGDTRAMPRRLLARGLLPQLPAPLRHAARAAMHGGDPSLNALASLLKPELRHEMAREAAMRGDLRRAEWPASRRAWIAWLWRLTDIGPEMHAGSEQVHGLRLRDVTAYRPLIEFCLGLPIDQFVRGGTQRFLARRLAKGRLPEAQRLNTAYGRHHAVWHVRLTGRLPELRAALAAMRDEPELARLVDVDEGLRRIDAWPAVPPSGPFAALPLFNALTGAVLVARFWRYANSSNR